MRPLLAGVLLLSACAKHVPVKPPAVAYRITRVRDKAVIVVQYLGSRTLEELRDEFCGDQTCLVEVIQLEWRLDR